LKNKSRKSCPLGNLPDKDKLFSTIMNGKYASNKAFSNGNPQTRLRACFPKKIYVQRIFQPSKHDCIPFFRFFYLKSGYDLKRQ